MKESELYKERNRIDFELRKLGREREQEKEVEELAKIKEQAEKIKPTNKQWISVKDKLPQLNGKQPPICDVLVIALDIHGGPYITTSRYGYYDMDCSKFDAIGRHGHERITHWMPYPTINEET